MLLMGNTGLVLPDAVPWRTPPGAPERSYENAPLAGDHSAPGPYMTLMRWHPGWMSAPHTYLADRLALVVSGIWWVGDGAEFDPTGCRSVPAGTYVHPFAPGPAGPPHTAAARAGAVEPAVIVVSGLAPLGLAFTDPASASLRRV